jgi:hypothetical protein
MPSAQHFSSSFDFPMRFQPHTGSFTHYLPGSCTVCHRYRTPAVCAPSLNRTVVVFVLLCCCRHHPSVVPG